MTNRRRKTILIIVAAAMVVVAAAALALVFPVLSNPDRYRSQVIAYLQSQTGKQIEIGHIGVNWFPLSIRIDNFGVKNPRPFPAGYVIETARIDAAVDARALLHHQVVIKSLVLHDPIINMVSDPDGLWNFENPPSPDQVRPPSFALGTIARVEIDGGQLFASSLIDPADLPGPVVFEAHDLAGNIEQLNFDAFLGHNSTEVAKGDMRIGSLRFGDVEATRLDCKLRLQSREISITDVRAELYDGSGTGDLTFNLSGKTPTFKAEAHMKRVNVDHLLLAAFRNAHGKISGTMEGDVKLGGQIEHTLRPLALIHGSGHMTVRNGKVPSLKLNQNLMKLAHFNDLGPAKQDPSSFSFISADLELANQRISSKSIDVDGYGVDVDGSGNVSVSGSDDLDYRGIAAITTKQGFVTNLVARMSGATLKDGKLSFPFHVSGTVENPVFEKGKKED